MGWGQSLNQDRGVVDVVSLAFDVGVRQTRKIIADHGPQRPTHDNGVSCNLPREQTFVPQMGEARCRSKGPTIKLGEHVFGEEVAKVDWAHVLVWDLLSGIVDVPALPPGDPSAARSVGVFEVNKVVILRQSGTEFLWRRGDGASTECNFHRVDMGCY